MFYKSHSKSEARAFDHLYDPIYSVSDNYRDIQRENAVALEKTAPVNIYTNYDSMFSDLPQHPRNSFALQRNPLPTPAVLNSKHLLQFIELHLYINCS